MATYTVHQAKTQLSELLRKVEAGEEVIIARGDKPVAVLKNYDREHARELKRIAAARRASEGMFEGLLSDEQLDEAARPLSDDEIETFYNSKVSP